MGHFLRLRTTTSAPLVGAEWIEMDLVSLMRDRNSGDHMILKPVKRPGVRVQEGWQENPHAIEFAWACSGVPWDEVIDAWEQILEMGSKEWRWQRVPASRRVWQPAACHHSVAATSGQPPPAAGGLFVG